MCSLMAFLFLAECHASKNSLLFHWGHLSIIAILSRSKSCPVCSVCLAKRKFRSMVAISCHIISYHIISYHIISYHIISYHIISYHIISYNSTRIFTVKSCITIGYI